MQLFQKSNISTVTEKYKPPTLADFSPMLHISLLQWRAEGGGGQGGHGPRAQALGGGGRPACRA